MKGQYITCIQCKNEFEFTLAEQEHFNARGFDPPKRCPSCRKNKTRLSESEGNNRHNKKRKYDKNNDEDDNDY